MHIIQAILEVNITALSQDHVSTFCSGLDLLLRNDKNSAKVRVVNILAQENTSKLFLYPKVH